MTTVSEPGLTLPSLTEAQQAKMTPLEQEIIGRIDAEMAKLHKKFAQPKAEFDRLAITRHNLLLGENGNGSATPAARAGGRATATRARRGGVDRDAEFLQLVKDRPGITITEAAGIMDVQPNYLYRVRKKAVANGTVREDDGKHYPVEAAAAA